MLCTRCHKKPVKARFPAIESLCESCFCKQIELRIRKDIRINKVFKKDDRILFFDKLSQKVVKGIIKGLPVKSFYKPGLINEKLESFVKDNKVNKVVIPWTLENEDCSFLEELFFGGKRVENNYIKLFSNVREDELRLFAKFKGVEFEGIKMNEKLRKFLDELENKYADVKFGLRRSVAKLIGEL
tara:strand:+ start:2774 stop:3328 length:555 start_codon:yes stop_codon:yes gene_type:complete